jgi:hypothetical protein
VQLADAAEHVKGLQAAASRPLEFRMADAMSFTSDTLAMDAEWVGDADALETGALQLQFFSQKGSVGEVTLGVPTPRRVRVVFEVRGLAPGPYMLAAALVDEAGHVMGSAEKPCYVIPGFCE